MVDLSDLVHLIMLLAFRKITVIFRLPDELVRGNDLLISNYRTRFFGCATLDLLLFQIHLMRFDSCFHFVFSQFTLKHNVLNVEVGGLEEFLS